MRRTLLFLSTFLIWAGTVSVHFDNQPTSNSPVILPCAEKGQGETLLSYLYAGKITSIRDNGRVLTVSLSSHWATSSSEVQHGAYNAIVCYARAQQRALQLVEIR